jgi:signal transduction histidine kinase
VARRGATLGGESAELAQLAGEQEANLRRLVSLPPPMIDATGLIDLRALLEPMANDAVTVSCPADAVPLPGVMAREVASAAAEALANVVRHAGDGARAWVLVEDDGDVVTVSIRDDGAGMASDRLAAARRDGRLGVDQSILGRIHDVGGVANIESTPGAGTEVELRVRRH